MRVFWAENRICRNERITTTRMVFVVPTCSFFRLSFIYFSRPHSWHRVRTSVCACVFICLQEYTTRQRNPKKYENFSFAGREFILSAGYISCVHVSLLLHYAFIPAAVFPLFLQRARARAHTHTHTSRVPDVYHHYGLTHKHALYIFIKT